MVHKFKKLTGNENIITFIEIEKQQTDFSDFGLTGDVEEALKYAEESAVERFQGKYPNLKFKVKRQVVER